MLIFAWIVAILCSFILLSNVFCLLRAATKVPAPEYLDWMLSALTIAAAWAFWYIAHH